MDRGLAMPHLQSVCFMGPISMDAISKNKGHRLEAEAAMGL